MMIENVDYQTGRGRILREVFEPVKAGMQEDLNERQVFSHLIPPSSPGTAHRIALSDLLSLFLGLPSDQN